MHVISLQLYTHGDENHYYLKVTTGVSIHQRELRIKAEERRNKLKRNPVCKLLVVVAVVCKYSLRSRLPCSNSD